MHIFTDDNGKEFRLKVDRVEKGVTYFVDAGDEVIISAQQVYDDLVAEISMSGKHFGACHEVITDRYVREHAKVSWEGLTPALRKRLVAYLEELRMGASEDPDDPCYNDGQAWAVTDIYV